MYAHLRMHGTYTLSDYMLEINVMKCQYNCKLLIVKIGVQMQAFMYIGPVVDYLKRWITGFFAGLDMQVYI